MATNIDTIHTREPSIASRGRSDTRLVRVDVSGLRLSDVRSFVRERGETPVYVERRAGNTYLVAERGAPA